MTLQHWQRVLSPIGRSLTNRWEKPCRNLFQALADTSPDDLLSLIQYGKLSNAHLTFATEQLGQTQLPAALPVLGHIALYHNAPVVREGAMYGLHAFECATAGIFIQMVAKWDPSATLREIAASA